MKRSLIVPGTRGRTVAPGMGSSEFVKSRFCRRPARRKELPCFRLCGGSPSIATNACTSLCTSACTALPTCVDDMKVCRMMPGAHVYDNVPYIARLVVSLGCTCAILRGSS